MIYFDPYLQHKVLASFHYALKEKGFLLIGKSETATSAQNLFEPIGNYGKIYIRKYAANRYMPEAFKPASISHKGSTELPEKTFKPETDFRKITTDIFFSKYTPASVIINEHLEIVHFHGDTGFFLLPSPGKPNFNILKMVREALGFELKNAILKRKKENTNIKKEHIIIKDLPYSVTFEVVSIPNNEELVMVLFFKNALPEAEKENKNRRKNADLKRIEGLENELAQLRDDIKRVIEVQQTAFEELQTTNEELLSSTEELQAMNEEFETSTEELQSNNEELMSVNDELMDRQQQLNAVRNYSESIFKTIREPLIIIDKDFNIKRANLSFYKYFQAKENVTEGYSLFDIGNFQWNIPEFKELMYKIQGEKTSIEDYKISITCKDDIKKNMMINARQIPDSNPSGMKLLAMEEVKD